MDSSGAWQAFSFGGMQYQLLLPANYDPANSYPMLLFLQGGGEENELPGMVDPSFNTPAFRAAYPAMVVVPVLQGSSINTTWGAYPADGTANSKGENQALAIVQQVTDSYAVDRSRVYVTGLSLGGHGAWDMIMKDNVYNGPQGRIFAAALPLSGAISSLGFDVPPTAAQLAQLNGVPVWAIHGVDGVQGWDTQVLIALGNDGSYHATLDSSLGHDVWDTYYPLPAGKPYYDWMFSQSASGVDGWTKLAALDVSTGGAVAAARQAYSGPVADLWNQYIAITSDNVNIAVASNGWFLHSGAGDDALAAYSGTNVLDGGTGSIFWSAAPGRIPSSSTRAGRRRTSGARWRIFTPVTRRRCGGWMARSGLTGSAGRARQAIPG